MQSETEKAEKRDLWYRIGANVLVPGLGVTIMVGQVNG